MTRFGQILVILVLTLSSFGFYAQTTDVVGVILDLDTEEPLPGTRIFIEGSGIEVLTDAEAKFSFVNQNLPLGEQVLGVSRTNYESKRYPIIIEEGKILNLGDLFLEVDMSEVNRQIGTISLSEDELDGDDASSFNISGLLASSQDTYLRAAAFDFSAAFFNPRGLDNANGELLINGLEMNKQFTGRPNWANWGGLNDVQRNRVFSMSTSASDYTIGDVAGVSNIIMRASKMRKGGRVSYASSNRSYRGRVMASYNTGLMNGGWSYSLLLSRRFGEEGFREGTLYDANSIALSVEKRITDKHSLNFTGFYAPNRRGMGTPVTQEVVDLKGIAYNPNWGLLNGIQRNSRIRKTEEPVLMLNHYWDISDRLSLNTNIGYQFGFSSTTRIDNGGTRLFEDPATGQQVFLGGARNPSPIYYQNLPSYYLRNPNPSPFDYQSAYLAQREFQAEGQFPWTELYFANHLNQSRGGNSTYALQSDRVEDKMFMANSILDYKVKDNITINARLNYRSLESENFARMEDLLGGERFLDVDFFAEETALLTGLGSDLAQSNLRTPNRTVEVGDRYKYNYKIHAEVMDAFAQAQFQFRSLDFYMGLSFGKTRYQRTGLYENGFFPGDRSFGPGEELDFTTYALKAGATYRWSGRHIFTLNAAYFQNAPTLRNSYSNARQNGDTVDGISEVNILSADVSYIYKSPVLSGRVSGFYTGFQDETNVGFYYTEELTGLPSANNQNNAFVQEVMTGIDRLHYGIEFGVEAQILSTLKLKAAGSFGQYIYTSNPELYLTSQNFPDLQLSFGDGKTDLKDLRVPGGPERVYQLGFEYRDPNYWNLGLTVNHFSHSYISPSGLLRSDNFALDTDGIVYNDYDEEVAGGILKQERFDPYRLVNVIAGKSWRVGSYYVGFFGVINNVLDQDYKTGGFEQSRTSNFRSRGEDLSRENGALFGNRYFFGFGTTYYLSAYIRF
ncbi:TonB-dependent receptor [Psychroflexus sp. CAK57W]|uniref:TonB-dependent receptor n=1 Tax=Psychroflexus curvus TaxID=2873595 RepID=UPI001CCF2C3D|nr:TonB-dependent receptor [Psychroflexus curvus]MBZ9786811.1 TonB-dependent receptor [Psychroflexus curvus]